jgi:uncharacterized protein YdiU (UPF0061 family)
VKPQKSVLKSHRVNDYTVFDQIDGSHSYKGAVPDGYIDYQVRTRPGGSVFFFNFELAKTMGLIPDDHPHEMTSELKSKILETFSLVIINEYDIIHKTKINPKDVRPNRYMATRYLQLQHPNKQGKTSGDGRGIWNGEIRHQGVTWDISSSGTGATCLSPSFAQTGEYVKTGDKTICYGNGYQSLNDGMQAALMSDIFHKNGIDTEQTLAILSFEAGTSINVRAAKCLLRPAHFFRQLKLGNYDGLKSAVDYYIDRQIANRDWPENGNTRNLKNRYQIFAEQMALTFSNIAARFESDYIFCWLDWDGDNILMNGGIIDYGSIRQFGLYHYEYRYDDVDRMSTNIPEQKSKARYIAQNFAQISDYLIHGKKRNIRKFRKDPLLKTFDQNFSRVLNLLLLKKLGLSEKQTHYILEENPGLVKSFKKHHSYFEKTKSKSGIYKTNDGITCDAIFCMKDIHRELPKRFMENESLLKCSDFIEIIQSSYAKKNDLKITPYRKSEIKSFQKKYLKIINLIAEKFNRGNLKKTLLEVIMRASIVNQENRITGDGVLHVATSLIRNQKSLKFDQRQKIIECVVQHQVKQKNPEVNPETKTGRIVLRNLKAIASYRDGF